MKDPKPTDSPLLSPRLDPSARRSAWPRVVTWLVVLAALLGGGYYYYFVHLEGQKTAADGAEKGDDKGEKSGGKGDGKKGGGGRRGNLNTGPTPVVAAEVKTDNLDVRLIALGTVTPRNSVVVRTRVDGPLLKVYFQEGQIVKVGQLLAEIDPLPLQAALAQSEGQLARDQALLQNAQIDLERYKGLLATESVPKQQYDTQEATVRQYRGIVQTDRGLVDAARLQLSYARIVSPLAGQVGLRQVDPGNIVKAGDANGLVTVTQMDPITVVAAIPENQVGALRRRMQDSAEVPVESWDSGMRRMIASGKLLSTDNQIDTATGTLKIKAEFANPRGQLFPNQFVNVRILLGQETGVVVIPQAAVQRGAQNGVYAYIVKEDSTVSVRQIKLGTVDGERVGVTSGLTAGERVVIDGADKLREGAKVQVIDRSATPAASPSAPGDNVKGKGGRRRGGKGEQGAGGAVSGGAAVGAPATPGSGG